MKKKILIPIFSCILALGAAFGVSTAKADWLSPTVEPSETSTTLEAEVTNNPVAYFNNRYFTTVEGAVKAATSLGIAVNVFVIPGTNPTIKQSFTIGSRVSLKLPYTNETILTYGMNGRHDDAYKNPGTYRKSLVTVGDAEHQGIKIMNYGTIEIGGVINGGGGGQDTASNTAGNYAELNFYGDSSLISYGIINNYGYITGTNCTGKVELKSGSNNTLVYTVREHRGGTTMSLMYYNLKSFPMSRWYFAGIRDITASFESGSNLTGLIDMYAAGSHHYTTISFIGGPGSSALVALATGSKLLCRCDTSTMITRYDVYGSFVFNVLSMYMIVSLTTESVEFPFSWYQQIYLHPFENGNSATVTSSRQAIKFMPGSFLSVDKNVSVLAKNLSFYGSNYIDAALNCPAYQNDGHMDDAYCLLNGSLSATYFGGLLKTTEIGASLSYSFGSIDTYEVSSQSGSSSVSYTKWTWKAKGKLSESGEATNFVNTAGNYISQGTYWSQA